MATNRMWDRVAGWFRAGAGHSTVTFVPDSDTVPISAYGGYLRVWLAEGFLATGRSWGNDHFPILHGGASLRFLGTEPTPFTTFARPKGSWTVPGGQFDFPITPLLPFNGGTVEVEAALYQGTTSGPLATALDVLGGLADLMGPPLATAAAITGKVADGLNLVLDSTGDDPILGVHWSMVSPGAGGNLLRSGHLLVAATPRLPGTPVFPGGRLAIGPDLQRLTGIDYLVLRVECREERDDWRFPDLDALIRAAGTAHLEGLPDAYRARRAEAVTKAWNSPDLTPNDRLRVAHLVATELDRVRDLGAVPEPGRNLQKAAAEHLPSPDAPELQSLSLEQLLR